MNQFEKQDNRDQYKKGLSEKIGNRFTEISPEIQAKLGVFYKEHRLEFVTEVEGVRFINDSLATNVNSLWFALEETPGPIILLMGGVDKGNDYFAVEDLMRAKVKHIVLLGKDLKVVDWFGQYIDTTPVKSMREAVATAFSIADKGDTVLLSPACASFDMFENYEDRGRQFKQFIKQI